MTSEDIEALRTGAKLSNNHYEELRRFTKSLIHSKGKVVQSDLDAFYEAGYTPQQVLEVILGIAIKTISNYTNSIAGTPLDNAVKSYHWTKPTIKLTKQD